MHRRAVAPAPGSPVDLAAPPILPKGTQVHLLAGKYRGSTRVIGFTQTTGTTVAYRSCGL